MKIPYNVFRELFVFLYKLSPPPSWENFNTMERN